MNLRERVEELIEILFDPKEDVTRDNTRTRLFNLVQKAQREERERCAGKVDAIINSPAPGYNNGFELLRMVNKAIREEEAEG